MTADLDHHFMALAMQQAEQALLHTTPNPRVGAVLVDTAGRLIGQGHTQPPGQAHAEVMALREAARQGYDPRGATLYVTLEPCSHFGRTPPCADAIVEAGIARVVVAMKDPHPRVAGRGMARLRAAGIPVDEGPLMHEALALNAGFVSRHVRSRPWVWMKVAASADGRTALNNGVSQWITGPEARADGQHWRARACGVLSGIGTVLADDPQLNVRAIATPRQPVRIVVDRDLRLPVSVRLLSSPGGPVWLYHAQPDSPERRAREAQLQAAGVARLVSLPDAEGKVDLLAMLQDLAAHDIQELHLEAGARLNGAFWAAGLVDELLLYQAPRLLGPGIGVADLPAQSILPDNHDWHWIEAMPVGHDLRLRMRRQSSWQALLDPLQTQSNQGV